MVGPAPEHRPFDTGHAAGVVSGAMPGSALHRLAGSEGHHLASHLLRLGPHDRMQRFSGRVSATWIRHYVDSVDSRPGLRVGYFHDRVLRGCGELYLFQGTDVLLEGEVALSVEARWQNCRIGTLLLAWLLLLARRRQVTTLHMQSRSDNDPMRALARRFGVHQAVFQGEMAGTLIIARRARGG